MKVYSTAIPEVKIIEYGKKKDNRGFSYTIYNKEAMEESGIYFEYKQENVYYSEKAGTLYGIHFQNNPKAQAKIIYCIAGKGIDYAVDLRKESSTYLKWVSVTLSADDGKQIYIPKGFGHAFISLAEGTRNVMRFDEPFDARYSRQIAYNDPAIGLVYPLSEVILAEHDVKAPLLVESDVNLQEITYINVNCHINGESVIRKFMIQKLLRQNFYFKIKKIKAIMEGIYDKR